MESAQTVAAAVLAQVLDALHTAGLGADIRTDYVAVGTAVWDDCCGQLVVAPERVYRTNPRLGPFPTEGGSDGDCAGNPIAIDLNVLLVRCVPTVDDAGNAPAPADIEAAYNLVLAEAAVVWNVLVGPDIVGDNDGWGGEWDRANVSQTWVGAEGGCIGTESRITLGIPFNEFCPPVPIPSGEAGE